MDFLGGADTLEELMIVYEDFLKMCSEAGITLNPKKVRIGFEDEQFFGLITIADYLNYHRRKTLK